MAQRHWYDHISAEEAVAMLEGTGAEVIAAESPLVHMHRTEFLRDDSDDAQAFSMGTSRHVSASHFREKYGGAKLIVYKRPLREGDDPGALMPDGAFTVRCAVWCAAAERAEISTLFEANLAKHRAVPIQ